jgi:hypothetical protein
MPRPAAGHEAEPGHGAEAETGVRQPVASGIPTSEECVEVRAEGEEGLHLGDLLLQRHARQEILDASVDRPGGVLVGGRLRLRGDGRRKHGPEQHDVKRHGTVSGD